MLYLHTFCKHLILIALKSISCHTSNFWFYIDFIRATVLQDEYGFEDLFLMNPFTFVIDK